MKANSLSGLQSSVGDKGVIAKHKYLPCLQNFIMKCLSVASQWPVCAKWAFVYLRVGEAVAEWASLPQSEEALSSSDYAGQEEHRPPPPPFPRTFFFPVFIIIIPYFSMPTRNFWKVLQGVPSGPTVELPSAWPGLGPRPLVQEGPAIGRKYSQACLFVSEEGWTRCAFCCR